MTCRLCAWLCDRFCPPELSNDALSRANDDWEQAYAFSCEPDEPDEVRARWAEARLVAETDPAAAFAIHLELAESGSPYSMLKCAWFYRTGRGVAQDDAAAEEFYRRALRAGSWRATVWYASALFKRGADDKWPGFLGECVDKGYIPAFFWLAWYRYKRAPNRWTAREVRHLMETAAEAGHPEARLILARWTASGKLGLREIPRGLVMVVALAKSHADARGRDRATASPAPVVRAPAGPDSGIDASVASFREKAA